MASVTFKRGTRAEIEATAKQDGQILMETDQNKKNKMYIDLPDGSRVLIGNSGEAIDTSYDNTTSGLDATNVQNAIDKIENNVGDISGITDSLTATSSNIALSAAGGNNLQGQIDALNSNLSNSNKIINSITNGKGVISYASLDVLEYGVYRTNELTANNSPSGNDTDGILIVIPCIYSSQLCVQIFWGFYTKQVHMRICWYGLYKDWIKLSQ